MKSCDILVVNMSNVWKRYFFANPVTYALKYIHIYVVDINLFSTSESTVVGTVGKGFLVLWRLLDHAF